MTFTQFVSILSARKWIAVAVFGLVVATTLALSLMLPKQYQGTASVVIDVKPDPVAATTFAAMTSPAFMATQVDIMSSERVARRVIRDLKLADSPQIQRQWKDETDGQGTVDQWLVVLLQKKLDVRPSQLSNVIQVSYTAPDPRYAAGLANAFAQAYVATTLELRVDPAQQFKKFFDAQTKDAREALERAQNRLSAYQQEKGIIATDERLDIESARLSELNSQLTQLQSLAAESASRQAQAQIQGDRMQEVLNNQLISTLKADLSRAEAKVKELTQRLGESHPQVVEARANIAELRARIDAETKRVTSGVGVSNTITRARESQVRSSLEAQRARVLQLKAVRDQGVVLQREVENAQRVFDNLVTRLNQTALEAQNTQSFANILTSATPPVDPASPKVLLNTVLAIFLGGLLAVVVVLALELRDRRIRQPEDVPAALELPVLGALPASDAKRAFIGRRAIGMQQRVLGLPAPAPVKGA